jgi:hypothetical protein
MLNVPKNSTVSIYNSGCCGMVLWLRKEHYDISMQMEDFISKIRSTAPTTTIAAAGTSRQIFDGTNRNAEHPVYFENLLK